MKLVLLGCGGYNFNTWLHDNSSDNLLANEVSTDSVSTSPCFVHPSGQMSKFGPENPHIPDLNLVKAGFIVLVHVDVDGEMCVDISHLVLKALCNTNNQVVNESSDCAESGDIFAGTVV